MEKVDLIIKNGYVLDFAQKGDEFIKQDLIVHNGKIIFIGKAKEYTADQEIDATEKIVMPGFINTHTHTAMSYFRGVADDLQLMDWLQNHIWPLEGHFLSPEYVYDAFLFGCADLIKNGITTFNDMYFHNHQAAEAAKKIGIRAILGEVMLENPAGNYDSVDRSLRITRELQTEYKDDNLIDIAVAPHAIYTCSKKSLIRARDLAAELDLSVHLHLSETKFEVQESLRKFGKRPVEYLDEFDFFQANTIAAHSLWLDDNEQKIFAKHHVSASINANSNYKLASGIRSFEGYRKNGVNLSFGTDSVASNNNLSMLSEINIFSKVQKVLSGNPQFLPAKELIKMATVNGAKALGKSASIGSLEVGKKADIITVDLNNIQSQPVYNIFSQLAYNLESEQIKDVIIDGKTIMINRKLVNIDENELLEKAKV